MKGQYKIPFDKHGNQLHYPDFRLHHWEDNFEFPGPVRVTGYARGCSAAYFEGRVESGRSLIIFLTDFEEMLPHLAGGSANGRFTFVKRGQNYGVKMISEPEAPADSLVISKTTYDGTDRTLPQPEKSVIVLGLNEVVYNIEGIDGWCTENRRTGFSPDYVRTTGDQWFYLPAAEADQV